MFPLFPRTFRLYIVAFSRLSGLARIAKECDLQIRRRRREERGEGRRGREERGGRGGYNDNGNGGKSEITASNSAKYQVSCVMSGRHFLRVC